jgi:hypothetical protein
LGGGLEAMTMIAGSQIGPYEVLAPPMLTGMIQSASEYDVTADGQRFLIGTTVNEANSTPVSVMLNWPAMLKR